MSIEWTVFYCEIRVQKRESRVSNKSGGPRGPRDLNFSTDWFLMYLFRHARYWKREKSKIFKHNKDRYHHHHHHHYIIFPKDFMNMN